MIKQKNKNFSHNRKAFFTSPLVDFFVYVVFVMILIFFISLFSITGGNIQQTIRSNVLDIDIEKNMLAYLRAPVEINGEIMQMSDIFYLFYLLEDDDFEDGYKELIKEDLTEIFSQEGKSFCWSLTFSDSVDDSKELGKISDCNTEGEESTILRIPKSMEFFIPNYNGVPLKLQFRINRFDPWVNI
jgi:hypothetical protein